MFNHKICLVVASFIFCSLVQIPNTHGKNINSSKSLGSPTVTIESLKKILENGIERDREIIKPIMSHSHLRKTRNRLAGDIEKKEKLLAKLKRFKKPAFKEVVDLLVENIESEKKLTIPTSVSDRHRRISCYAIKKGIPIKERAVKVLDNWLDSN